MTLRESCFLCRFLQHGTRLWKCWWDYFEFSRCNPPKDFSRSYLQRRKMENRRQKENLTTCWEFLNYKKSSQQLPPCVSVWVCRFLPSPLFKQMDSMYRSQKTENVVKISAWHTRLRRVCHVFVFTTLWRHMWSLAKLKIANITEYKTCSITLKTPLITKQEVAKKSRNRNTAHHFDVLMNAIKNLSFSGTNFKALLAQVFYPHGQSVLSSFKNLVTSCNHDIWKSQEKLKKWKSREILYVFSANKDNAR